MTTLKEHVVDGEVQSPVVLEPYTDYGDCSYLTSFKNITFAEHIRMSNLHGIQHVTDVTLPNGCTLMGMRNVISFNNFSVGEFCIITELTSLKDLGNFKFPKNLYLSETIGIDFSEAGDGVITNELPKPPTTRVTELLKKNERDSLKIGHSRYINEL